MEAVFEEIFKIRKKKTLKNILGRQFWKKKSKKKKLPDICFFLHHSHK